MKKEKGEAAFNSVDEVLTDRIIHQTEKHGRENDTSDPDSTSNYSFDSEIEPEEPAKPRGKGLVIGIVAGIVLLIAGILMFRRKK